MEPTNVVENKRCTGHCCKAFTLPFSPNELKRNLEAIDKGKTQFKRDSGLMRHTCENKDIRYITDMVIFKGLRQKIPQSGKLLSKHMDFESFKKAYGDNPTTFQEKLDEYARVVKGDKVYLHVYTCKHFDKKAGNCTAYESRPAMCSNYPYNRKCEYKQCTSSCNEELEKEWGDIDCVSKKELEPKL